MYDEETESYSEELENLKGDIADLTKTTSTPGGISLFTDDTKQTYKSTYQILEDISNIWDKLSDKNQAELLEKLAGKRQGQIISAIISNFDSAREAMDLMANSAGNAQAEMDIVTDSVGYKLNRLKETGTGIAQNLFQRDDMKNLLDLLNNFAGVIDAITEKLGLAKTVATGVFAVLATKGKTIVEYGENGLSLGNLFHYNTNAEQYRKPIDQFKQLDLSGSEFKADDGTTNWAKISEAIEGADETAVSYFKTLEDGNGVIQNQSASVSGLSDYLKVTGRSFDLAAIKAKALNIALNTGIALVATFVIQGIATLIDNLAHKTERLRERTNELNDSYKETQDTLEEHKKTASELADRYDELRKGVDITGDTISNKNLSADEYKEFLDISNKLAETFPELVSGIDANGNSLLNLGEKGKTAAQQLDEILEKEERIAGYRIGETIDETIKGTVTYVDDALDAKAQRDEIIKNINNSIKPYQEGVDLQKVKLGKISGLASGNINYGTSPFFDMQTGATQWYNSLSAQRREELLYKGIPDATSILNYSEKANGDYNVTADLSQLTDKEIADLQNSINQILMNSAEGILNQAAEDLDKAKADYDSFDLTAQAQWDEAIGGFYTSEKVMPLFKKLVGEGENEDKGMSEAVEKMITNFDYTVSKEMADYNGGSHKWLVDYFINPLSKLTTLEKERFKNAINGLYELDPADATPETQKKIGQYIDILAELLNADPVKLRVQLGYEFDPNDYNTTEQQAEQVNQIIEKLDFKKAWKSLDTTTDEALKNTKKDLLELAEAGNLTNETFSKTGGAKVWADSVTEPIDTIVKKINKLVDSSTQLNAMSSGISALSENLYTRSQKEDIGADTLAGMPEALKACREEWEEYERVVGDSTTSMAEVKEATNALATAYVNSANFLANLTNANKNYYISQLETMGVENAREVVVNALENKHEALRLKTQALEAANTDFANSSTAATDRLLQESGASETVRISLLRLLAQEQAFSASTIGVDGRIKRLNALASAYLGVQNAIQGHSWQYRKEGESAEEEVDRQFNKLLDDAAAVNATQVAVSPAIPKSSGSGGKKSGTGKKNSGQTKQEQSKAFDYIEIRLKRLEAEHTKYLNKAQNETKKLETRQKAYADVLKTTDKQINTLDKAIERYNKKLDKNKLSENIKKKLREGKIDIDTLKGKTATRADDYLSTYEKVLELENQKDELKAGKKDDKRASLQLDVDSLESQREQLKATADSLQDLFDLDSASGDYTKVNQALANLIPNYNSINDIIRQQQKLVKEGSEQWWEYQKAIDANNQSVEELNKTMINNVSEGLDKNIEALDDTNEWYSAKEENATTAYAKNRFVDSQIRLARDKMAQYNSNVQEMGQTVFDNAGAEYDKIADYVNSGVTIPPNVISSITNSVLAEACNAYNAKVTARDLYEASYKTNIGELAQRQADNIVSEAEIGLNAKSRQRQSLETALKKNELLGRGQTREQYQQQIALSKEQQEMWEGERERLQALLREKIENGEIMESETDPAYRHYIELINNATTSVQDCTLEQIEFNNAIRDLDFSNIETLIDLLGKVKNGYSRIHSLIDVHNSVPSDELTADELINLFTTIENNQKEADDIIDRVIADMVSEEEGGTNRWGFGLTSRQGWDVRKLLEQGDFLGVTKYLNGMGFENVNKDYFPELFENFDQLEQITDSIFNDKVSAEELADNWFGKVIDEANKYLDNLEKQKDVKDRIYAIEKAQYDLDKARNNLTKKVWDGHQWVYAGDREAIQSAQEAFDNAIWDELVNTGEDLIEALQECADAFNFYDDYGNPITNLTPQAVQDFATEHGFTSFAEWLKENSNEETTADVNDLFAKWTSLLSAKPISYNAPTPYSIPSGAEHNTMNIDKIEFVLPNINDSSTAEDLAKGLIGQLASLSSYAKQYDWNK